MTPKFYDLSEAPEDTGMQCLVEDIAEHGVDELEVYGGKWNIMWFRKDGKYCLGISVYDNEEEAQLSIGECVSWLFGTVPEGKIRNRLATPDGFRIETWNFSHAIPMPVKTPEPEGDE